MLKVGLKEIINYGIVFALILVSYIRLYYGADFQDESFYITLPYRFILGNLPLVDETSICQFAGILLIPFYKLFFLFQKTTNGIVIYGRHLLFIFYSLLGWLCFSVCKKQMGKNEAMLLSTICILYIPYNVMGVSYNTMSILFFTAASFFVIADYQSKFLDKKKQIYAGIFYFFSVFSYPPMILPVLIAMLIVTTTNGFRRSVINFSIGILPLTVVSLMFVYAYWSDLMQVYVWLQQTGHTKEKKLGVQYFLNFLEVFSIFKTIGLFGVGLLIFNLFRHNKTINASPFTMYSMKLLGYVSLVALPISATSIYGYYFSQCTKPEKLNVFVNMFIITISMLAPLYVYLAKNKNFSRKIFLVAWIPSFLAGMLTGIVSGTGFYNSVIGLFPAFIISNILIYLAIKNFYCNELNCSGEVKSWLKFFPNLTLLLILAVLVIFKFGVVIRDSQLKDLQVKVTSGPYKYIRTSEQRNSFIEQLQADLNYMIEMYHIGDIFAYPRVFGTYLFTNLKPMTNTIWVEQGFDNSPTIDYFNKNSIPEMAVIFKNLVKNKDEDRIMRLVESELYLPIVVRGTYTIYVLNKLIN